MTNPITASMSGGIHRHRHHRLLGAIAGLSAFASLLSTLARALPQGWQALPYVPVIVSFTPWFIVVSALSLFLALIARRWGIALIMVLCLCVQVWWQYPFFNSTQPLSADASTAVSASRVDTTDAYAQVMTVNVYKGHADAQTIVRLVKQHHIEILAMQETDAAFIEALNKDGIGEYLPYSQVSSSDGVYGNGLWSASPLSDPVDDEVNSSASLMPAGTVKFNGGRSSIRFVSVHTTSPKPGTWTEWLRALQELGNMRSRTSARYVFMGDFNATTDHTAFRDFLGDRFHDAARSAGHGFTFTWPANRSYLPAFAGIDHIVFDSGIDAGNMQVVRVPGSDHDGLIGTLEVQ